MLKGGELSIPRFSISPPTGTPKVPPEKRRRIDKTNKCISISQIDGALKVADTKGTILNLGFWLGV